MLVGRLKKLDKINQARFVFIVTATVSRLKPHLSADQHEKKSSWPTVGLNVTQVLVMAEDGINNSIFSNIIGLELAIDPPPPRGNFVHYDFLKLHYIRRKIKYVSPLRVAALTCNITLYTLPPKLALNVPDNVSTMTCPYISAC